MDITTLIDKAQDIAGQQDEPEVSNAIRTLVRELRRHCGDVSFYTKRSGRKRLTKRQRNILVGIIEYKRANGMSPTVRELQTMFRIGSTNGVNDHLQAIIRKGYLIHHKGKARSLRPRAADGTLF